MPAFFFLLAFSTLHALTFTVPAGQEMCFFEELEKDETMKGHFQVVRGGDRIIHFQIIDPKSEKVAEFKDSTDQRFSFVSQHEGIYKLCASNPSSFASKQFSLVTESVQRSTTDRQSLKGSLESLQSTLNGILTEQNYIKQREIITRDTTESTNSNVLWWSLAQIGVVIITTIIQYFLFKRIFKK
ncbi:putative p24 complex component [Monocercomonoides exilis]|uniref:putative p24 complex component n=1 Tax=Monocercomonoides exilis TaxID=2049356 RepID=UPI003559CB1C|nr:putative p24 complex component [Monocercomonoides exilis]|eukprot:MONOS_9218.1-p1 / transcript=MONOS_9218.1 / gene=MONOS_9218 / organism=Monocercomonoides_exilis_PA203 / gene_product=supernatant protein factor, C-terminal domain-containing protein / transcript_product=supernatant protein factor, C-terminal domain-containing protein / location=Mono_scaffold00372:27619-28702(+) / protein_length=184 / sequence_SO=supercontig / SO=protein_coding / is_pseudo=false